jgi:ABC-type transport system involved in cytochrome bd biosynthesis fused ATPase/permease subunit
MGKGEVLERGTHEELFAKEGSYYQLVKTQMSAEEQQGNQDDEPEKHVLQ